MIKFATLFLMMTAPAWAQYSPSDELRNMTMCGTKNHRFDPATNACIYCAQGLHSNKELKCEGTPDVLGKCYGSHHYHAATQECMFCAKGFSFDEKSRQCGGVRSE